MNCINFVIFLVLSYFACIKIFFLMKIEEIVNKLAPHRRTFV